MNKYYVMFEDKWFNTSTCYREALISKEAHEHYWNMEFRIIDSKGIEYYS